MLPAGLKLLRRLVPPPTRPLASQYDYVIVGAGSAGCVLANELTQDASASVLLIEAGTLSVSSIDAIDCDRNSPVDVHAGGWDANPLIHIPPASTASSRTRVSIGTGSPSRKRAAAVEESSCRAAKWSAVRPRSTRWSTCAATPWIMMAGPTPTPVAGAVALRARLTLLQGLRAQRPRRVGLPRRFWPFRSYSRGDGERVV